MSLATSGFKTALNLFRSWGFKANEEPGCWGNNNGISEYRFNIPVGNINHHFGVSPSEMHASDEQGFADMLRNGYNTGNGFLPGPVVPAFIGVTGTLYFISDGPSNHAGQGASYVVNLLRGGNAPVGPADYVYGRNSDDGVKNDVYSGNECQHPGDGSDYPEPMIRSIVAWNAALTVAFNWPESGACSIHHYESTYRKPDMSWRNGVDGDGGPYLRKGVSNWVKAYFAGTKLSPDTDPWSIPTTGEFVMDSAAQARFDAIEKKLGDFTTTLQGLLIDVIQTHKFKSSSSLGGRELTIPDMVAEVNKLVGSDINVDTRTETAVDKLGALKQ